MSPIVVCTARLQRSSIWMLLVCLQLFLGRQQLVANAWTPALPGSRPSLLSKMMATVSGIESTPNPSSFLVRLSQPVSGMEDIEGLKGKTFTTAATAGGSSEIGDILAIDGVTSVYAMATPPALTIMKHVSGKWEEILPLVMAAIHTDQNDSTADDSILQSLLATVLDASKTNQQDTALRGQVRLRLQASYRIPIQLEASGFLGTTKRVKASSKFSQCMQDLIEAADTAEGSIAKIHFFANRKWMDQGVRYLDLEDDTGIDSSSLSEQDQEASDIDTVLAAELENLDAAYSPERLASLVTKALRGDEKTQQLESSSGLDDDDFDATDLDLQKVDQYCDMADHGDMQALLILAKFVASHDGEMAARRSALAFLGGTGDIVTTTAAKKKRNKEQDYGATVLDAVTSALQNEKNPIMRRTAGDALSDLGDDRAVPPACVALVEDKSKLVQWRAARILGELGASLDVVGVLKQASFSDKYAFEVAFEIKDALRKVKERIQQQQQQNEEGSVNGASNTGTGPVWKQIQQGMDSS